MYFKNISILKKHQFYILGSLQTYEIVEMSYFHCIPIEYLPLYSALQSLSCTLSRQKITADFCDRIFYCWKLMSNWRHFHRKNQTRAEPIQWPIYLPIWMTDQEKIENFVTL